jgi:hypothetical protein
MPGRPGAAAFAAKCAGALYDFSSTVHATLVAVARVNLHQWCLWRICRKYE